SFTVPAHSWVRKYKNDGIDGLKDKQGLNKTAEDLTEEEKLKLRIKELEAQNEYLKMENAIQKKLQEIQAYYRSFH
ncbi:hypothetical protein ABE244_17280, partial [Bacillus toyonensis]